MAAVAASYRRVLVSTGLANFLISCTGIENAPFTLEILSQILQARTLIKMQITFKAITEVLVAPFGGKELYCTLYMESLIDTGL